MLYIKFNRDSELDLSLILEDKEKLDVMVKSVIKGKYIKDFVILEEDCIIGEVILKIYWEYFRSGLYLLVIFFLFFLCVII